MSLDVSLKGPKYTTTCTCTDCGNSHTRVTADVYFEQNITHNLGAMAKAAELYTVLWHPESCGIRTASQLVEHLRPGLEILLASPEKFRTLNPPNGWGTYEALVGFVSNYITGCEAYPDAFVETDT